MKRHERRHERETGGATEIHRLEEVRARVPLVEERQHSIVQRLYGARDERAAAGSESRQQILDAEADARP